MDENLDSLLEMLEQENSFQDTGLSSFESQEAFEYEEHLVGRKGYPRRRAQALSRRIAKRPNVARKMRSAMSQNSGQGAISIDVEGVPKLAATFTLKAERLTTNLAQDLPIAFFGTLDAFSNYIRFIVPPAGLTVTYIEGLPSGKAEQSILRYTDGVNIDDIVITCQQAPYPSFLHSLVSDKVKLSKLRYSISDTTKQAQFSQGLTVQVASLFGKRSQQTIDIESFKSPQQFQAGIVDLDGVFNVDKETAFTHVLLAANGPNFSISISFFAEAYYSLR